MIDLEFLEKLIRTLDASGLDHIEIERGGTRIRVSRTPVPIVMGPSAGENPAAGHVPDSGAPLPPDGGRSGSQGGETVGGASTDTELESASRNRLVEVTSPMVGTFYRAASPDSDPFAEVGSRIAKGDVLCIIEAMKLMNELEADLDGTVREICVSNGEPVEYGQVLFRVERS